METAKESSSRFIGKFGIVIVFLLVVVAVYSAKELKAEALTPVIGLVATAVMAIIGMLSGITGTKDKEEKPEFTIIQKLIEQSKEPMTVTVEGDKVTVCKGQDKIITEK
jgi:cadmium resistance protein CadD (predicted permease)